MGLNWIIWIVFCWIGDKCFICVFFFSEINLFFGIKLSFSNVWNCVLRIVEFNFGVLLKIEFIIGIGSESDLFVIGKKFWFGSWNNVFWLVSF